jgi:carbamoyl-phosphate synthase large subunit
VTSSEAGSGGLKIPSRSPEWTNVTTSTHALSGGLLSGQAAVQLGLLLGLSLVAAALAWRFVRLVRIRSGVRSGLDDSDAAVRLAAVRQAAELGLATTAPTLLRAVRREADPAVLAGVVDTVASRQWEPASTGSIVELRLWARAYADQHPELRGGRTGAPLLPGVVGATTPPSLDPDRADEFKRGADLRPTDPVVVTEVATVPDPDPVHPTTVLVTGAGGAAGIAVIRALIRQGHRVVAVDADELATGLRLAHSGHVVPSAADPSYVAALLRVVTVESVQAMICTVAEEYPALEGARPYLQEADVHCFFPRTDAVTTCLDKWAFATAMTEAGLPVPRTGLAGAEDIPGPWVVKPRFGRGSRDVHYASSQRAVRAALSATKHAIVQTQVSGREFTVDALVDDTGALVAAAPRWRLETKAGISTKGETFADDEVVTVCGLVLKVVGLRGPANVQGFVTEDGAVVIVEVNPRFSGGLPLTLHAGADLVGEYLRMVLGLPVRPERLVARPGVRMMRHHAEVFEG